MNNKFTRFIISLFSEEIANEWLYEKVGLTEYLRILDERRK